MVNNIQVSTNIRVLVKTKKVLESKGKYGETMDQIIQRLIFQADNGKVVVGQKEQDKVLKSKL